MGGEKKSEKGFKETHRDRQENRRERGERKPKLGLFEDGHIAKKNGWADA